MAKDCGFSRLIKEGEGGPGVGPLAPVDVWRGQDVHVDVAGRGRKRLPQGIAVPPSVHKAADCPPGQHQHDKFDYCHPEERKHRGTPKQKVEKPEFVNLYNELLKRRRELTKVYSAAYAALYSAEEHGGNVEEARKLRNEVYGELRDINSELWGLRRQVQQWRKSQRPEAELEQGLEETRKKLYHETDPEKRARLFDEVHAWKDAIADEKRKRQEKRLPQEVRNMMETAQSIIKFPMKVKHIVMGGRHLASYDSDSETISLSPRTIKKLREFQKASAEGTLTHHALDRVAFFCTILFHELMHSANPISKRDYRYSYGEALEEGLTDWTAWYMGRRFASDILGQDFDWEKATGVGPPETKRDARFDKYGRWMVKVANYAQTAGGGDEKAKSYYITKWKFYTSPAIRPQVITEDLTRAMVLAQTGIKATPEQMYEHLPNTLNEMQQKIKGTYKASMGRAREAFEKEKAALIESAEPPKKEDDLELLPWQKRLRARAWRKGRWSEQWGPRPEKEPFQRAIRKVLGGLWRVMGFEFKGDVWPPIGDPEGHAGGAGPRAGSSAMAPSNVDVRYTGSPPRGVSWQKLPRQGGHAPGGAGAGAVEAAVEEPRKRC